MNITFWVLSQEFQFSPMENNFSAEDENAKSRE